MTDEELTRSIRECETRRGLMIRQGLKETTAYRANNQCEDDLLKQLFRLRFSKGEAMIVSTGQSYQIASEGSVQGVLAEVVDLGLLQVEWNGEKKIQHKCQLIFEITEEKDGDTQERLTVSRRFTASLDERGNLRKFLEGWRGRAFTPDEAKAFDLDTLVGVNAILSLSHNEKGGKTYCNVASAARLLQGMPKITLSQAYTPYAEILAKRNAAKAQAVGMSQETNREPGDEEDEIPF